MVGWLGISCYVSLLSCYAVDFRLSCSSPNVVYMFLFLPEYVKNPQTQHKDVLEHAKQKSTA